MQKTYLIADDSLFARMVIKEALKIIDPGAVLLDAVNGVEVWKRGIPIFFDRGIFSPWMWRLRSKNRMMESFGEDEFERKDDGV